jgi:hypothetical protein
MLAQFTAALCYAGPLCRSLRPRNTFRGSRISDKKGAKPLFAAQIMKAQTVDAAQPGNTSSGAL